MNRPTNNKRDARSRTWSVIVFIILLISVVAATSRCRRSQSSGAGYQRQEALDLVLG